MKELRTLLPHEIECRVQTIRENGCSLLLYKDARCDMKLLDETYGNDNWQRSHEVIGGNLYCNIDIWCKEKKTWVRKQDIGVESQQASEKGQASDAFKRAGFNVGIGRELYTSPFIWIPLGAGETRNNNGKVALNFKVQLRVGTIEYDYYRNITALTIVDQDGVVRFKMGEYTKPKQENKPAKKADVKTSTAKTIGKVEVTLKEALANVSKCENIEQLLGVWNDNDGLWTEEEFAKAMTAKKIEITKN